MKRILRVLIMALFFSFINTITISALPVCNINSCSTPACEEKGYGKIVYREDKSASNYNGITACKLQLNQCKNEIFKGWQTESASDRTILAEYNMSKQEGNKLSKAYFEIYTNKDDATPACSYHLDVAEKEVASLELYIKKGKIHHIVFYGSYVDSNGTLQTLPSESISIKRKLGPEEEDVKNIETDEETDQPIGSEDNAVSSSGPGSAYGENSTDNNGNQLFTTTTKAPDKPLGDDTLNGGIYISGNRGFTCDEGLTKFIKQYWKWVLILTPALLMVMCTVDFIKALVSSNADELKKAGTNTIKRVVATLLLVCLPLLLNSVMNLMGFEFCW